MIDKDTPLDSLYTYLFSDLKKCSVIDDVSLFKSCYLRIKIKDFTHYKLLVLKCVKSIKNWLFIVVNTIYIFNQGSFLYLLTNNPKLVQIYHSKPYFCLQGIHISFSLIHKSLSLNLVIYLLINTNHCNFYSFFDFKFFTIKYLFLTRRCFSSTTYFFLPRSFKDLTVVKFT